MTVCGLSSLGVGSGLGEDSGLGIRSPRPPRPRSRFGGLKFSAGLGIYFPGRQPEKQEISSMNAKRCGQMVLRDFTGRVIHLYWAVVNCKSCQHSSPWLRTRSVIGIIYASFDP